MTKIDLRPHYAFAYSVESMTFGSKSCIFGYFACRHINIMFIFGYVHNIL